LTVGEPVLHRQSSDVARYREDSMTPTPTREEPAGTPEFDEMVKELDALLQGDPADEAGDELDRILARFAAAAAD
jgi:hypothetical protein